MTPTAEQREAIDRPLGWLTAIGGCILILDQTLAQLGGVAGFAPWWNVGGGLVAVAVVALAAAGLFLPLRVLEVCWRAVPIAYLALQATWVLGVAGADPEAVVPWLWTLEPAVITLLMLVARPAVAIVTGFAYCLVPGLSGLLFLGHVPQAVLAETPGQLGNVLYLIIFVALRVPLQRLHATEARARLEQTRQLRAAARLEQQVALQRIVHDDVLSVLTSAMLTSGPPSGALRLDARRAIDALGAAGAGPAATDTSVDGRAAAALIAADLRRIDPEVTVEVRSHSAPVPLDVATGLGQAAVEALRNSVLHAGSGVSRTVRIDATEEGIQVRIRDDGIGFDPVLSGQRLGIAESIVGRMTDLGGCARIDSAPGLGTEVVLAWSD
ncbi:sensor histidine kinase [Propionicimonas sp.]|uniref:sensor histidine kinase n=1 Tax=Propionicimonas sp. TaxID=1955623 RepID=UPI0039E72BA8